MLRRRGEDQLLVAAVWIGGVDQAVAVRILAEERDAAVGAEHLRTGWRCRRRAEHDHDDPPHDRESSQSVHGESPLPRTAPNESTPMLAVPARGSGRAGPQGGLQTSVNAGSIPNKSLQAVIQPI